MKTHTEKILIPSTNNTTTTKPVISSSSSRYQPSSSSPSSLSSSLYPAPHVLRDSSNVASAGRPEEDDDDAQDERLVIDLDLVTGSAASSSSSSKLSPDPPSVLSQGKMSTAGHEQHEATVDKGLKMKIKRKNMTGKDSNSTNCGSLVKSNNSASEHNSENNGAGAALQNSPPQGTNSGNTVMPSPFEKLKQAILEREKTTKGPASSKGLHHKREHHMKGKGNSPLSGNSAVAMGSPSGNPSGISLNGVVGDERGTNSAFGGSQKSVDLTSTAMDDPYEFNVKAEDSRVVGFPVSKKLKIEKHDVELAAAPRGAMVDVGVETGCISDGVSGVGVITEPDLLGLCEPGTHVNLQGIVWQETNNGLLVVNVTWRGKTYVGTLIDATKHEYGPPCFRSESPNDLENRTPGRGGRGKRGRQTMNSTGGRGRSTRSSCNPHLSCSSVFAIPASPVKAAEKRRAAPSEEAPPAKRTRSGCSTPGAENSVGDEKLIECPEPNCEKKYRHVNGLKYHQSHSHKDVMLKEQQGEAYTDNDDEDMTPANSTKDAQSEDTVETVLKKEKKKKNRDGKKKKGKKNPDQSHASHDEDTSTRTELQSLSKQATLQVQLKHVCVTKTVTAPIATVPVASNPNMLQSEHKSKKINNKSDRKGDQTEDSRIESKEKKGKKKKKDKHRAKQQSVDKIQKTISNSKCNSKDIKPVITVSDRTSPAKAEASGQMLIKLEELESQQPMNLSSKTEESRSPLATPEKARVQSGSGGTVQSPAYSDISDDGADGATEESSLTNSEIENKPKDIKQPVPHSSQASTAFCQPPGHAHVLTAPQNHSQHLIMNLTTKEKSEDSNSSSNNKDTQPKEGAPVEGKQARTDKYYGVQGMPYPYPPYSFLDPGYMQYGGSQVVFDEQKRKQQQQQQEAGGDNKHLPLTVEPKPHSPSARNNEERKPERVSTSRVHEQSFAAAVRTASDRERQAHDFHRSILESMTPEKRAKYENQPRHLLYEKEGQQRERDRKISAAQGHASVVPSTISTSSHDVKKEHLHSPVLTPSSKPNPPRSLIEERLRAPEERIRSEDRVRGSPSPRRTPTPNSKAESSSIARATATTTYGPQSFYSPPYPGAGFYPPRAHPYMAFSGYHPAQVDGKALEMLQQHAQHQHAQQQHNERVREHEHRLQSSPASRHLYPIPPNMFTHYPGSPPRLSGPK